MPFLCVVSKSVCNSTNECFCVLQSFLQRERSEENLVFWRQCNFYRKAVNRKRLARIIYDEYIDESAPNEVNIDATIRDVIKQRLADAPADLFDDAQRHIYHLMKRDSYKRFIVSRMYRTAAELREADAELERLRRERAATDKSRSSLKPSMRFSWHSGKTTSRHSGRSYDVIVPNGHRVAAEEKGTGGRLAEASAPRSPAVTHETHDKKHRSVSKILGKMVRSLSSKLSSAADNSNNTTEKDSREMLSASTTNHTTASSDLSMMTSGDVTLTPQRFSRLDTVSTHSAVEPMRSNTRRQRKRKDGGSLVNAAVDSRESSLSSQINVVFERQRHHRSTFSGFKSKLERLKRSVIEPRDNVIATTGNASLVSSTGVSFTNKSVSSTAGTDVDFRLARCSRPALNAFERSLATRQQFDPNVLSTPVAEHRKPAPRAETKSIHKKDLRNVFVYYL